MSLLVAGGGRQASCGGGGTLRQWKSTPCNLGDGPTQPGRFAASHHLPTCLSFRPTPPKATKLALFPFSVFVLS